MYAVLFGYTLNELCMMPVPLDKKPKPLGASVKVCMTQ
ncbi:hypothetical protein GAGA_3368 [Paraglaciecola agarilytica NO2]|uniref:Uncharacterized protein n=1 Tax=Paraglaciecola agarilytica NO2 TaxID=1125747 RepID=A0ABQ0IA04_9ALTE|nr:hypothetical protein GAGA_3368 [Paraglaciecola agarilytica NO2]